MCDKYSIPHSFFLGGPHRWTEADQDKALAYMRLKDITCSKCGTIEEDWWEFDEFGNRRLKQPLAYRPTMRRCEGCEMVEHEQTKVPAEEKGVYIHLVPNDEDFEQEEEEGPGREVDLEILGYE